MPFPFDFDEDETPQAAPVSETSAPQAPGPQVGAQVPSIMGVDTSELQKADPAAFDALHSTFSTQGSAITPQDYNYAGLKPEEVQKTLIGNLQQLYSKLDSNSEENKTLQTHLNRLSYTPEQRTQDIYNKMFGVTKDPTTGETHRNWLKTIVSTLGEMGLAASHKENYVPAMERARAQAIQQYNAEAGPAAKELLYSTQDRRALQNNISSGLRVTSQNQIAAQQAAIKKFQTDIQAAKAKAYIDLTPDKKRVLDAQADKYIAQGDYQGALQTYLEGPKTDLTITQAKNAAASGGLGGVAGETNHIQGMKDEAAALRAKGDTEGAAALETKAKNYEALFGKNLQLQKPETFSTIQMGDTPMRISNRTNTVRAVTPPGTSGGGVGSVGTTGQPSTVNGVPVPSNLTPVPDDQRTWRTPKEAGHGNMPLVIQKQFPDTPPGRTPQNDSLFTYPISTPLTAAQKKRVDDSLVLWQNGREFNQTLDKIDPRKFGTIQGNLNGLLTGKTSSSDPDLMRLKSLANAVAFSHLGTQGSRSSGAAEDLAKEINSWGSSPAAIKSYLSGLVGNAGNVLRATPSSKSAASHVINSYRDMEEIYEPDTFAKDMAAARAELQKRRGNK